MFIYNKSKLTLSCLIVLYYNFTYGMENKMNNFNKSNYNGNSNDKEQNSVEIATNNVNITSDKNGKEEFNKLTDIKEILMEYKDDEEVNIVNEILKYGDLSKLKDLLALSEKARNIYNWYRLIKFFYSHTNSHKNNLKETYEALVNIIRMIREQKISKMYKRDAKIIGDFVENEDNKKFFIDLVEEKNFIFFKNKRLDNKSNILFKCNVLTKSKGCKIYSNEFSVPNGAKIKVRDLNGNSSDNSVYYGISYGYEITINSKYSVENTYKGIDLSNLFKSCTDMVSAEIVSNGERYLVSNSAYMFYDCTFLKTITGLNLLDIRNVRDMSYMFSHCYNLSSLPDINKWNTSNVTNMDYVFNQCTSLVSLPDISNWNTSNVINMSHMFNRCFNLK